MSNIDSRKPATVRSKFSSFLKDSAGSVAQMFALSTIPMFFAAGVAIDMAQITNDRTEFQAAVDGAILAIASDSRSALGGLTGSALESRKAQLKQIAEDYLDKNFMEPTGTQGTVDVTLTVSGNDVTIDASVASDKNKSVLGDLNLVNFELEASSVVTKAARPTELVMVMDTTGSMAGSKLTGAKDAAKKLLDTLYGGNLTAAPRSEFVRLGFVPFSGAVRLDTAHNDFKLNWIDTGGTNPLSKLNFDAASAPTAWNNYYAWSRLKRTSSINHTWNGCVEARMRGTGAADYAANDAAPVSGATLFPAYFNPDAPGTSSSTSSTSYGANYIQWSGTPNETTGLSSSVYDSYSTGNLLVKQENYRKYDGRNIGAESTSASGPWSNCAATKLVPMTYDRAAINAGIDAMVASGPTLIAEGLAWGFRAISPTEPLTQVQGSGALAATTIAPYGDVRWKKIMVLMTDGDNDLGAGSYGHNVTTYSAYGRGGEALANNRFGTTTSSAIMTALDDDMLKVCSNIKAAGVELYVSSFGSGVSTTTKNRLKSCASSETHYKHAAATSDLVAFFDHIAEETVNKQIYVKK
jgi:Flp pilus assembly protein TadG